MTGVFFSVTFTSVALQEANRARPQINTAATRVLDWYARIITNSQIPRRVVRFVRWEAIRREHGIHPRPIFRGQQAGTARNKTDDTDCLSIRSVYRRLDTSSPHKNRRPQAGSADNYNAAGRLISIRRLTKAIVPARRMAFKRTVTLSRVEPTMEAISR